MYQEFKMDPKKDIESESLKVQDAFGAKSTVSPGFAAQYLGISRQAVDHAIKRGSLRACRVYWGTKHVSTDIDCYSLEKYKELRSLNGGRIPYRARAV